MGPQLPVLCFLALLYSYGSAMPTENSFIVTSTEQSSESSSPEEVTTEQPMQPIKLLEMDVKSEVSLRYASTSVVTRIRNPATKAQETTFRVLLPETAFISGFVMTLDGKSYKAYVKQKDEAKQIYTQAVSQGFGAAHISAKARDSNHFTVNVNVEPNTIAVFNLTYEELLVRRNGVYNHAINLHPGGLVPLMKVTVHIKESEKLTKLRVPAVRTGNEVDATDDDPENPLAVIDRGENEATITFTPDLEEQKRLIALYLEKSKQSATRSWQRKNEDDQSGVLGQFVVQYDVNRPENGEILVNDGYFVHFYAPPSLPPLQKHAVFVLDTSGSMSGRKIEQLREAMKSILSELNSGDYFSIVEFATNVKVHNLNDSTQDKRPTYDLYSEETKPVKLVPPYAATADNLDRAKVVIGRMDAGGGTNIDLALDVATTLVKKGINWKAEDKSAPTTTAQPIDETESRALKTEPEVSGAKLEPIIIFLTDGDPTVGESDPKRIINRLSEKNFGDNKAAIFSLAFGEDADRNFLRRLSLRNEGFMRHIYEGADAVLQLRDFYRQVSSPLLANVHFVYPPGQVDANKLTKHKFDTYYAGSELVVAGEVVNNGNGTDLSPEIEAEAGEAGGGRKRYSVKAKMPLQITTKRYLPLERLWAYLTIKQLLDEHDASDEPDVFVSDKMKENSPSKRALDLALRFEFVTPLTSLVVVKPNATDAVNSESVDKTDEQLPRPSASLFSSYGPPQYGVAAQSLGAIAPVAFEHSLVLSEDYAIDEEDSPTGDVDRIVGALMPMSTTAVPTTENPLSAYHLDDFAWTKPLVDAASDTLKMAVNGTEVVLKLSKDAQASLPQGGGEQCARAISGGAVGSCVYLTQCEAARNITVDEYKNTFCKLPEGFAGVCCPQNKQSTP